MLLLNVFTVPDVHTARRHLGLPKHGKSYFKTLTTELLFSRGIIAAGGLAALRSAAGPAGGSERCGRSGPERLPAPGDGTGGPAPTEPGGHAQGLPPRRSCLPLHLASPSPATDCPAKRGVGEAEHARWAAGAPRRAPGVSRRRGAGSEAARLSLPAGSRRRGRRRCWVLSAAARARSAPRRRLR